MTPRPPDDRDDETLIREYLADPNGRAGRRAVDALISRWSGRVLRWVRRVVRDRDEALDVAQDSMLRMLEALPRYEPRGRFPAWLFVIVHHRCLTVARSRPLLRDPEIDADTLIAGDAGPADDHESAESLRRVEAAMDSALDERERTAIWLRAHEGMSVADITEILGLESATGARGLLQTARRKLRAALRPAEGEGRT